MPAANELPAAVPDTALALRLPYVWILPALVILAGAFVAIHEKIAQGTSIEISFHTADDLEPNKTKIRYKAVEIGEVTAIHVAKDRKEVIVEAKIHRDAGDYLVADTRFWVVRPRVTGGNVTGLGTLVSGAYIGVDVGHSSVKRRTFTGLEVPPIVTSGLPGRQVILHAEDIGSLSIGSTVFYRHIPAGEVVAYVSIRAAPASPSRCSSTRPTTDCDRGDPFLASERHRHVDHSDGVRLHTESLASILEGGVAFQQAAGSTSTAPVAETPPFAYSRIASAPCASRTIGANLRHVFQGLAARTVRRRAGRPSRHHDRRGQEAVGRIRPRCRRAALSGGSGHLPAAHPRRPRPHDRARGAEDADDDGSDAANRR